MNDVNRILMGIAGILVILGIAFLLSSNKRAIRLRVVGAAFALQAGIAALVLYTPWRARGAAGGARAGPHRVAARAAAERCSRRRGRGAGSRAWRAESPICSATPTRAPNSCSGRPRT